MHALCYKEPQTCSQETSLEAGVEHRAVSLAFCIELAGVKVWVCLFACFILCWVTGVEFVQSTSTD